MTLNDIKKAALALMFTNYSDDLADANVNVDNLSSEEYTQYTVNMNASINRCLGRIESAGVLPLKTQEITTATTGSVSGNFARYNLSTLASDFLSVSRIAKETAGGEYIPSVKYHVEGTTVVLPPLETGDKYIVIYRRRPTRISITAVSSTVVDVPDNIAEIIPYYIKADLYEEDEPNLALQARNIFESLLMQFVVDESSGDQGVVNVWGGGNQ